MRKAIGGFAAAVLLFPGGWSGNAFSGGGGGMRLYVSNSLGDDITVIDLDSMKPVQTLKVGEHVHGVCASADGRRLFTTIESERNLKTIDTLTGRILDVIPLTGRPNQCAATPDGRYAGVPIRDGDSVDIVDLRAKKVAKVLPVRVPHNCYNPGNNADMYVSSMGDDEIDRIDLRKMDFSAKLPVGGIPRPYAVSKDEKAMYVALTDFHGFAVVSIPGRKVLERVELPPAPESKCVLEPHTPTHGLELSPDGGKLWVTSLGDNGVYVYDLAARKFSDRIAAGKCPNWIALSPDGKYSAVSNSASDDCSIIDTRTLREAARVKVGKGPKQGSWGVELPSQRHRGRGAAAEPRAPAARFRTFPGGRLAGCMGESVRGPLGRNRRMTCMAANRMHGNARIGNTVGQGCGAEGSCAKKNGSK